MNRHPQPPARRPRSRALFTISAVLFAFCSLLFTPASAARADVGFALPSKAIVQQPLGYKTDAAGQVILDKNGFPTAGPWTLFPIDASILACGPNGNACQDLTLWQLRYGPGRATAADKFSPGERGGTLAAALGALCEEAKVAGPISLPGNRGFAKVGGGVDCRATKVEIGDAWFAGYYASALEAANRLDLPDPTCEPTVCADPEPCPSCPVCAIGCPVPADLLGMALNFLAKCDAPDAPRCDWRAVRVASAVVEADNHCPRDTPLVASAFAPSIQAAAPERAAPTAIGGDLGQTLLQFLLRAVCESVLPK